MKPDEILAAKSAIRQYVMTEMIAARQKQVRILNEKRAALQTQLAFSGHGRGSVHDIRNIEFVVECNAAILQAVADAYIAGYKARGLRIGPEVLKHLEQLVTELATTSKQSLLKTSAMSGGRSGGGLNYVNHLGSLDGRGRETLNAIKAQIELYNLAPVQSAQPSVAFHLHGVNSRVNIGSVDSSTNILNEEQLFEKLTAALEAGVQVEEERRQLLAGVADLRQEAKKESFYRRYSEFVALAANHIQLVMPFLPALAELAHKLP